MKKHLSVANVLSCVALFVALSGAAYAAGLGRNAVRTRNIANGAVNTPKLRNNSVNARKLRNGAVTGPKLANGAVGTSKLADASVRSTTLGGGVVTTAKLKNLAVTAGKLGNNAVTSSKIAAGSVETGKLANEAVTGEKLAAGLLAQLVKNVSYEKASTVVDAEEDPKGTTANCPAGKEAIGGGVRLLGGETVKEIAITQSGPVFSETTGKATGWFGQARPFETGGPAWGLDVHAICAEL